MPQYEVEVLVVLVKTVRGKNIDDAFRRASKLFVAPKHPFPVDPQIRSIVRMEPRVLRIVPKVPTPEKL